MNNSPATLLEIIKIILIIKRCSQVSRFNDQSKLNYRKLAERSKREREKKKENCTLLIFINFIHIFTVC